MCDPKSLVQSGDFIRIKGRMWFAFEYRGQIAVMMEDASYLLSEFIDDSIEKVYRFKEHNFCFPQGMGEVFSEGNHIVVYDKQNEVKEVTIKELEELFKCKVKIVKENE